MNEKRYEDYFNIDPKYYAAVTADLIESGQVRWDAFYPHETFVKFLEKLHAMLSGSDPRSLWVEGAYGVGKSHAALAAKSLLDASDEEIRAYFEEYGLSQDLCQKIITDKHSGRLITLLRIGSASIRSDQDLILAIQDSISAALKEHGIENHGEASLKDAALKWLEEKEANRRYFDSLIHEEKYGWDLGGMNVDQIISILKNSDDSEAVSKMMRNILKVAEDNGITALRMDVNGLCDWIKSILDSNEEVSAILFVWDEFTEYFKNNPNSLTGFQTLAEISASHPFYFLIVTHESSALILDKDMRKKILNRFVGDVALRIEMPENMAFRLMAQAMKTTDDPVLLPEWIEYKNDLNNALIDVRNTIIADAKKHATMGKKTIINDAELQAIFPIHPYAALLLKHISVAFNSNARSMFDFIISNDMTDAKGFKWFIHEYGPLDHTNLLTIDMLWDFFNGKDQNGLNDDVRVILDSFRLLKKDSLTPDQIRVFKTVLLLEAISVRVADVDILRPNEQNIDLAFNGTDWVKGKARSIAAGLCQQGLLFERPVGGGMKEYTAANRDSDVVKIRALIEKERLNTKTSKLVESADLLSAIKLPASIQQRFNTTAITEGNFTKEIDKINRAVKANRFSTVVTFAQNDREAAVLKNHIAKTISLPSNKLFIIETLVPMGEDLFNQYVENTAYMENYRKNDKERAKGFERQANKCLSQWKQNIEAGAFILYTPENHSGIRAANLQALNEMLLRLNHQVYYCGLEQYSLIDNMFNKGPLAQGAECGIKEELKATFKSSNPNTSLENALKGVWKTEKYWEDPAKNSLPIVRIKLEVERLIQEGFEKPAGRVSVLSIFQALEDAPFGFIPNNVSAFIMGFVLKEYAVPEFFWSNGSSSETMTSDKMKQMIANAINQVHSPSTKFKEEYIVAMSANLRCFIQCTSTAFHIPVNLCGSVEDARNQIRIKMKSFSFPIWCIKYALGEAHLESNPDDIRMIIDAFSGIANTANSNQKTESDLADSIGKLVNANPIIINDLERLFTTEMCRKGMLSYIAQFEGGVLLTLAEEIGDNGAYIDRVKQKFNADAANWVWSSETADDKISDVILEYKINAENNKTWNRCKNLQDMTLDWSKRVNNIKIPYDLLRKEAGDIDQFLKQLYYIKQSGQLLEQNKLPFYNALVTQGENFSIFYKNQLPYFKKVNMVFLDDLSDQDIADFFATIASGQFMKSGTEYYNYIQNELERFKATIKRNQIKNLWIDKTGTKDPMDWSEKNLTPILCMFDDQELTEARQIFNIMMAHTASDADISKVISYLENATFFNRLKDANERDRCFNLRVIGEYATMLQDIDSVRRDLINNTSEKAYYWMESAAVKNRIKMLAHKQYKLSGYDRALAVIDRMDASELRRYLNDLIADNLNVGMEILKNA